mmetsp:Transcript_9125/g.25513  ORF Transcript_9125/g.25513 Transcript_9125/m.25513 type:complete len:215 (+) Transcript_9125:317-961(+)
MGDPAAVRSTRVQKAKSTTAETQRIGFGAVQTELPRPQRVRGQRARPMAPTVSWLLVSTAEWPLTVRSVSPEFNTEEAANAPMPAMSTAGGEKSRAMLRCRMLPVQTARLTISWRIAKLTTQPPTALIAPAACMPGSRGLQRQLGPPCMSLQPDISLHVCWLLGGSLCCLQASSRPLWQLTTRNCWPSPHTLEHGPQGPVFHAQPDTLTQGLAA